MGQLAGDLLCEQHLLRGDGEVGGDSEGSGDGVGGNDGAGDGGSIIGGGSTSLSLYSISSLFLILFGFIGASSIIFCGVSSFTSSLPFPSSSTSFSSVEEVGSKEVTHNEG